MSSTQSARPFLKWAGGKRALMDQILARIPAGPIEMYVEPFLGGGATFFALAAAGRLVGDVVLSDRNPELVETWAAVRDAPESLIEAVGQWDVSEANFYHVRDGLDPDRLDHVTRAARVLWLNRTCFNGLYRKNRSGRFNVSYGRYTNPRTVDADNIRRCADALRRAEIVCGDFEEVIVRCLHGADRRRMLLYLDPPYIPVSATSSFNCYDGLSFEDSDQQRVAAVAGMAIGMGADVVAHNSWTDRSIEIWAGVAGVEVIAVDVRRSISRNGDGRGPVPEMMAISRRLALDTGRASR